jgi:CheY-like chemotaxis protein
VVAQHKYKLVLVEDSEDDVILFELTLRRTGLHEFFDIVRRFPSGEQAIEYFMNHPKTLDPEPLPDIVILDIKLSGITGFDVLAAVRRMESRPVVAMFTSSCLAEDKQKAEALGADFFQTKTFQPDEFSDFLHWLARLASERRPQTG